MIVGVTAFVIVICGCDFAVGFVFLIVLFVVVLLFVFVFVFTCPICTRVHIWCTPPHSTMQNPLTQLWEPIPKCVFLQV